jgi:hypothetical protein
MNDYDPSLDAAGSYDAALAAKKARGDSGYPHKWPADAVQRVSLKSIVPYPTNARTHSASQIDQIAASIRQWGWTVPVLVDENNEIIAGHGRLEAAKLLGLDTVPVMVAKGWSERQIKAYRLADNQLALNAAWDVKLLAAELGELTDMAELIGFSDDELLRVLGSRQGLTDPDEAPPPPETPTTQRGDLWVCGRHRILCGDATNTEDVTQVLGEVKPDIANCDPPYGISVVKGSHIGGAKPFGNGKGRVHGPARKAIIQPGIYAPIIGDNSTDTGVKAFHILNDIEIPAIVMWGGNYFADQLPASRCWLVWDKENTGSFADAELAWTNQDAIVRLLRHQWSGLIKASERNERRVHPTQKPVALIEWMIETINPKARTLLDPFLGSGSSLIACERRQIDCYGMELSEGYVDVAVRRWEAFTGETATRHPAAA